MDGLEWKTLLKMHDLEVPLFSETPISLGLPFLLHIPMKKTSKVKDMCVETQFWSLFYEQKAGIRKTRSEDLGEPDGELTPGELTEPFKSFGTQTMNSVISFLPSAFLLNVSPC